MSENSLRVLVNINESCHLVSILVQLFESAWYFWEEKLPIVEIFGEHFSGSCPNHTPVQIKCSNLHEQTFQEKKDLKRQQYWTTLVAPWRPCSVAAIIAPSPTSLHSAHPGIILFKEGWFSVVITFLLRKSPVLHSHPSMVCILTISFSFCQTLGPPPTPSCPTLLLSQGFWLVGVKLQSPQDNCCSLFHLKTKWG